MSQNHGSNGSPTFIAPHDVVASHLFHVGFQQGAYSDLVVRLQLAGDGQDAVFKLHKLLAVRSPCLAALVQEAEMHGEGFGTPLDLTLAVADPAVTADGLSIALGSLYADYAPSILASSLQNPATTPAQRAKLLTGVLGAACLLLLPQLASLAAELVKQDINNDSLPLYCAFVTEQTEFFKQQAKDQHLAAQPDAASASAPSPTTPNPNSQWILEIRDAIFAFLCKGIVRDICDRRACLIWGNKGSDAYKELVQIFSELPYEWLKKVVEGQDFEVPNDMERFAFAKEVVALRALNQRTNKTNLVTGEENVLLSFGGGKAGASGVTLVRKAPKLVMTPQQVQQQQQIQYQQQQQQQYLQQQQQQFAYGVMDQYSDLNTQQQQMYHQNMAAQGFNGMVPQERRVWKAGNN
ncbi:hypothetical protein HDU98_011795 [Podochytrium sp. JEL0797]|nr:hypothetical protein HDU98_011795 [Podochytrium sp. JEL0797]